MIRCATKFSISFLTICLALATSQFAQAQGTVNVTGQLVNNAGKVVHTFQGTLDITQFTVANGQIVAQGLLSGKVVNSAGKFVHTVTNVPVMLPLSGMTGQDPPAVCQVLNLTLGPIDLNLLGLMLHVDQIHLDLTANPAGGLLGQLLCGLADSLSNLLGQPITLGDLLGLDNGTLTGLLGLTGLLDDVLNILDGALA